MTTAFADIGLSLIATSITNPRKSFNPERMQELADSIKASGVHTPVLVRFLPGSRAPDTDREVIYELVAGERRYRASQMAGMDTIPAMIRPLSDDQVLEIQLVENLQRDDLTELEEAEGYESLMQHSGINADQVGAKIGKSRSYVYARLKLLDLSLECKEAMRVGQIDASRALLIARIPDTKLQIKALEFAVTTDYKGDVPSVRSLQTWLRSNVMLVLENASFKITDARLVEAAGSCKDCPKRTGSNPDLFAEVDGADICTDPECFHLKEAAHRERLVKKAEAKGIKLVEGKEAKEICSPWQSIPSGYCMLSTVRADLARGGEEPQTLRELLGDDVPETILFEHPRTKELMEVVRTKDAEALLLAKGLATELPDGEDEEYLQDELEHLKNRAEVDIRRTTHRAIWDATVAAIRLAPMTGSESILPSDFLRAWLILQVSEEYTNMETMAAAVGYVFMEGEDEMDGLVMHLNRCSSADIFRATAIMLMQEDFHVTSATEPTLLNAMAKHQQVNTKALAKGAAAEVKAKFAAEAKAIQAKIDAKKPVPSTPAAQPVEGAGGNVAKSRAAKTKLTAADAQSGIAAAMQELEQQPADPLYEQALALVIKEQKASKRLLKESLRIGQIKALQLLDQMEQEGKVSACDERGARKVLVAA